MRFVRHFSIAVFALFPSLVAAESWTVIKDESKIEFTATQSGSPTGGAFPVYNALINFDRDDLASSMVRIEIDLGQVETSYADVAINLVQEPWFNVQLFPNAIFQATTFVAAEDETYEAQGTVTIRGIAQPVVLTFGFESYGPHPTKEGWLKAVMVGEATLQRTAYGVGQGEWEATDVVADNVAINVRLSAEAPTE